MIVLLILSPALTKASDCSDALDKCDIAIEALEKDVTNLEQIVRLQEDHIKDLNKLVIDNESILPTWAWVVLGAGVGGIVIGVAK